MVDIAFECASPPQPTLPCTERDEPPIGGMEANIFAALGTQLQLMGDVIFHLGAPSPAKLDLKMIMQSLQVSTTALAKCAAEANLTPKLQVVSNGNDAKVDNDDHDVNINIGTEVDEGNTELAATRPKDIVLTRQAAPEVHSAYRGSFIDTADSTALPKRKSVKEIVQHTAFDMAIGVVICCNAVTIGWETSNNAEGLPVPIWILFLERIFLALYIWELALRVYAFNVQVFQSNWVKFDAFLVFCGILNEILLISGGARELLDQIMLVRLCRLARLARVVRLMVQFHVLFLLLQGLLESLKTLVWTFVVMTIVLYVFAVLGMELIPDPTMSASYQNVVDQNFVNLETSLLTLLQGLTLDSLGSVYRPLLVEKPILYLYFIPFISLVSIALMNLVTAIMVENALDQADDDKKLMDEHRKELKKNIVAELEQVFAVLDGDGSGTLSIDEVLSSSPDVQNRVFAVMNTRDQSEIREIFHTMDYDGSGHLTIHEFCEGLTRILDGKPIELSCLMKQCRDIMDSQRQLSMIAAQFPKNYDFTV